MQCEMLGKKCARTFCMAFSHKRVRDKDGCKEMKGYCRHYRKFWKVDVAQEPVEQANIERAPNEQHNDLSLSRKTNIHDKSYFL